MAETHSRSEGEDPRRLRAALRQRYAGLAILGLAILLYWCARIFVAWWRG